jgi:hypothetical protein
VLIPILYRFYIRALSADAMVSRKALQADLQKASSLTVELETLMTRIWRSREPTIVPLLAPFGSMFQEWQLWHPSGVAWIGLVRDFGLTCKLLADTLTDDPGGPRPSIAFDLLMLELAEWHRTILSGLAVAEPTEKIPAADAEAPRSRKVTLEERFRFLASVWHAFRKTELALRKTEQELGLSPVQLKLPPSEEALRKKLDLLDLRK